MPDHDGGNAKQEAQSKGRKESRGSNPFSKARNENCSLQWDCGLVSRIGSQGSVAMTHGRPHMECARTVVIAGDTCHDETIYMPVLHQVMTLHSFSSLSES